MLLSAEVNDRYTRVGPGTPMGELMRRYWHPIAAVSQMNDKWTMKVRLLGEDLILYKDRSGTFGLMEPHCAHRRMNMIYGIPEENGLRCPYHGWLYDETGQCIEQPYEETEDPEARFKDKMSMKAYPVRDQGGLLHAYLGPEPAPLLPPYDLYLEENYTREIGYAELPCNYLQVMENSLDPVHVEWLHQYMRNFVVGQMGQPERARRVQRHEKIGFDAFEHGIVKRRVLVGGSEDDEEWATGHPVIFPCILKSDSSNVPVFQIRVPVNDEHRGYFWYRCYRPDSGVELREQTSTEIPYFTAPVPDLVEGVPHWDVLDNNSGQDIVAWITQGAIADRTGEHLGRSDKGVLLYRQQLENALRVVEDGGDPMNVFRREPPGRWIGFAVEENKFGTGGKVVGQAESERSGNTTKYSPLLKERDASAR